MAKLFRYFQPEYVGKFKCDGSKCNARCCKGWTITIDTAAYKKYSRIKPKSIAKEITSHIKFDSERESYVVQLAQTENARVCPFLTEDKLCGIQLKFGENFLSRTCVTYPRITYCLGKFFERSMTLTCPVAAEMILFNPEPMNFEFIEVPDNVHSKHGRVFIKKMQTDENNANLFLEIQITMISILQRRCFTLDQRLIVLGLFIDKLQEMIFIEDNDEDIKNLIVAYSSEEFLLQEILPLLQSFTFDAKKFITFMIKFINHTMDVLRTSSGEKFFTAFTNTLQINPDENNQVSLSEITANYERLADARKNFIEKYSTFLENYLVNELFSNLYPKHFIDKSLTKNFIVFLISYKIFELMTFATVQSGLDSKEDLLAMVDWYMDRTGHTKSLYKRFLELLEGVDDTYLIMMTLL